MEKRAAKLDRDLTYHRRSHLWRNFGFIPNPNLSIKANTINKFLQTPSEEFANQPWNMAFHNLCKGSRQPPIGIGNLLGLGLNYCIKTPFLYQGQPIVGTNRHLHRDVRLGVKFSSFNEEQDTIDKDFGLYDPKLYC